MNVENVMSRDAYVVRMDDRLDAAARVLWEQDCGFVPVVDRAGVLVGVLTDRDLCMAGYTQGKPLAELSVLSAMARELATTTPETPLDDAMARMAERQVRRLPVVDDRGVLVGVLSTNDLVQVGKARPAALSAKHLVETLAAITQPRSGARDFAAEAKPAGKRSSTKAPAKGAAEKATAAKGTAEKADEAKASAPAGDAAKKASTRKASTKKAAGRGRSSTRRKA